MKNQPELEIDVEQEDTRTPDESRSSSVLPLSVYQGLGGLCFLVQLFLLIFGYNVQAEVVLLGIGWILLIPSFLLAASSLSTIVPGPVEGSSHRSTEDTPLAESGAYGLVRHPLYVGWVMISAGLALILQSWLGLALFAVQTFAVARLILAEEQDNEEKFGEAYLSYQQRVPRVNLAVGVVRRIRGRRG